MKPCAVEQCWGRAGEAGGFSPPCGSWRLLWVSECASCAPGYLGICSCGSFLCRRGIHAQTALLQGPCSSQPASPWNWPHCGFCRGAPVESQPTMCISRRPLTEASRLLSEPATGDDVTRGNTWMRK